MATKRTAASVPKTIQGVDVASFQGPPATWSPEAGAIKWAAVKITELEPGNVRFVNPDAAADWAFVAQQKLGRIAYLFGHPSVSADDTVSFFADSVNPLKLLDTDGIMLDLETNDGLGAAQVSAWAVQVMAGLKKTFSRTPILYTFISFAQEGNTKGLGRYPLWISDPSSPAGHPTVPPPWRTWTIHQYSTSNPIDRDVAKFATVAAMQRKFGVPPSPPKPQSHNLGGEVKGGVTAVRWSDGSMMIAALGAEKHVTIRLFEGGTGKWGIWFHPSKVKADGPPGLVAWGKGFGQLFYPAANGDVIELATEDFGKHWK